MVACTCNDQMEKMTSTMLSSYQDLSQMTNQTMNVAMQSASIMTKGCEEILTNLSNLMKSSFENNMSATKTIFTAKSIQEAMDAQASLMKNNTDYVMSQVNKLSQISSRVAQDAITPMTEHLNSTWTKVANVAKAA